MIQLSLPPAESRVTESAAIPARRQLSTGELVLTAIVILIGVGVGLVLAVFIALVSGWIPLDLC